MTLEEFSRHGAAQGMRLAGSNIVGVQTGFPYNISLKSGSGKDTAAIRFALNQALPGKDRKALKGIVQKGIRITYLQTQVLFTITAAPEELFHAVSSLITQAVNCFQNSAKPIAAPHKCFICNKPDCDSAALNGDGVGALYQPAHASCVMEKSEKLAYKAQKNEQSGNVFLGFIGAILGGFVGTLPNTALIMLAERHSAYLYFLIPLGAYFGYKLLRGRMGNFARLSVILSSFAAFAFMQFFIEYLDFIQLGYTVTFLEVVDWYFRANSAGEILRSIAYGGIALLIGLITSFSQIGKSNRDFIQQANANVDSLLSLHGEPPVPHTHSHTNPAGPDGNCFSESASNEHHGYDPEKPPMEIDP